MAERGTMPESFFTIILKLVEWEFNRRASQDQKKVSPTTFVNNGTINIDIHMDKD